MSTITTDTPVKGDGQIDAGTAPGEPIYLDAPGTTLKDTWVNAGPGIAAAMTGIGASHIMHGPTAGAQYGYVLLWIIPFAYLPQPTSLNTAVSSSPIATRWSKAKPS